MMSSKFICLFLLRYESYVCGGLLNLIIHFMLILAHGSLLVILLWSLYEDLLLFYKSCHVDDVLLKYLIVCLVKHPNFRSLAHHLVLLSVYV
jgi:hypothetical protein